jgi:hypothetical protein
LPSRTRHCRLAGVGEKSGVNDVADPALERPDGFLTGLALGSFAVVIGAARTAVVADLGDGSHVDGMVDPSVSSSGESVDLPLAASMRGRRAAIAELRDLIGQEEAAIEEPERFGVANAAFHERLVSLTGNQTLSIVAEMLNEIVTQAVTAVSQTDDVVGSISIRRRGIRSQERLLELLAAGDGTGAEEHWRAHMQVVGRVMLGQEASTVVDLLHHY